MPSATALRVGARALIRQRREQSGCLRCSRGTMKPETVPSPMRRAGTACLAILAAGLVGCHHATKLAAKTLEGGPAVPIAPELLHGALELRYAKNEDVAFSAFRAFGLAPSATFLTVLSVVAIAVALVSIALSRRTEPARSLHRDALARIGFAMALGGGLGNVIDRAARGGVVDFIHVKGWPIFNVADIAIVVGLALVVLRWRAHGEGAQAPT